VDFNSRQVRGDRKSPLNAIMRYRLRTLLIFLAIAPPLLAGAWLLLIRHRALRNIDTARVHVTVLEEATYHYILDTAQLPPDLDALIRPPKTLTSPQKWTGPYLERPQVPTDPWHRPYRYEPLDKQRIKFRISSDGPDKTPGTNDDITTP
jgi:general secretion pathway protein G